MADVGVGLGRLGGLGVGTEEGQGVALLLAQVDTAAVVLRDQQVPDQLQLALLKTRGKRRAGFNAIELELEATQELLSDVVEARE